VPLFLAALARASDDGRMPPVLLALSLVIQLAFVVHVYRSGAPRYWVLVILAVPVAGCLAYYFLEAFPQSRGGHEAQRAGPESTGALAPGRALGEKAEQLILCGSIDNRVALAEECVAAGLLDEAVMLYRRSLAGAYENDPHLLFGLARALVESRAWDDAADAVARLRRDHPCHRANETRLLHVRVLEATGETDAALAEYRDLIGAFVGLEARYRHALLLERLGRGDESRAALEQIVAQAKRNTSPIEPEARWANLARERLV
jgi:hypothetical protein